MSDATALRAEAAEARAEAAASFERVDTDGFVSQWASGINAQLADAKAGTAREILEPIKQRRNSLLPNPSLKVRW